MARPRARAGFGGAIALLLIAAATARCGDVNAALEHLSEARDLSADLLVQFTKSADAANRAVMADTDEASVAFARESEYATQAVRKDAAALGPMLDGLHYTEEAAVLRQFVAQFGEYRTLDRKILDLAVENTNLKAQRLSFGPAQDAANAIRDALDAVTPASPADAWHVKALAASAMATVREIQVLQAPHIADADDEVMTRMEKNMAASEAAARTALASVAPLVQAASRAQVASAVRALDRFMSLNGEIIALSRRNTNVRSLALSLNDKRPLTTACEDSLRALHDALVKRGYPKGR